MRSFALFVIMIVLAASCGEGRNSGKKPETHGNGAGTESSAVTNPEDPAGSVINLPAESGSGQAAPAGLPAGAILIASDIVTEVIIKPDPEGDPWDIEKVAGYTGQPLVDGIFSRIYDGSMTVYDYHSGEPLKPADVKKIEGEFKNDRTKIGKLSFTEDWYWLPEENRVEKRAKSVTFGYELYNNTGKVYAYRAAFRADLN